MNVFLRLWHMIPFVLPEISSLLLVLMGFALSLRPSREAIEHSRKLQIIVAGLCLLLGFIGFLFGVSGRLTNEEATQKLVTQTTTTVSNTNDLVSRTNDLATKTTTLVNEANETLARLGRMEPRVSQIIARVDEQEKRLAAQRFSEMTASQLAENAHSIANAMNDWQYSYRYQDSQISFRYYDQLEGQSANWTQREKDEWIAEEKRMRAELLAQYESSAERFVSTANRLRSAMLEKLPPMDVDYDDERARLLFENPRSDKKGGSLLGRFNEMSKYLENLAKRLMDRKS